MTTFLDELTPEQFDLLASVRVMPGERCPCCGDRKPKVERELHSDGPHGYVPAPRVRFIFDEIVHRIGMSEAARQIPYQRVTLRKLIEGRKPFVTRTVVHRAMLLLVELRRDDVVHSARSIQRGALARGEEPSRPNGHRDYYRPKYDYETELRREQRKRERHMTELTGY